MTMLQTSQNSWQNKTGKKDAVVKPVRIGRLSVMLFSIENSLGLNAFKICHIYICFMCILSSLTFLPFNLKYALEPLKSFLISILHKSYPFLSVES